MIRTLADDATRDIWNGVNSKAARRIPQELWPIVRRKLDQVDAVTRLDDLKVPPGNRLHALGGDLRGFHAVRVNDQYRIVFRFEGGDAYTGGSTDEAENFVCRDADAVYALGGALVRAILRSRPVFQAASGPRSVTVPAAVFARAS